MGLTPLAVVIVTLTIFAPALEPAPIVNWTRVALKSAQYVVVIPPTVAPLQFTDPSCAVVMKLVPVTVMVLLM